MLPTEHDAGRTPTLGQTYAELTVQWVRQTRAYARSLRAYQARARPRGRPGPRSYQPGPEAGLPGMGDALVAVTPLPPPAPAPCSTAPLTRRQFEVAGLIAHGLSNEEIARELVLTLGTVGNHVGHILRRLGARNRAQVATWVTQVTAPGGTGGSPVS